MKPIYVSHTSLDYFVADVSENVCTFTEQEISENAFKGSYGVEGIVLSNARKIAKGAFSNCEDLFFIQCAEKTGIDKDKNAVISSNQISDIHENFIVEARAFEDCASLGCVIFPKCDTLTIEKDAFDGCGSLRTVVAFCEHIDFTENPFAGCPETLTFVGTQGSCVERFARENGYRFVNA